jgi:hypothetical protein
MYVLETRGRFGACRRSGLIGAGAREMSAAKIKNEDRVGNMTRDGSPDISHYDISPWNK